MEKNEQFQQIFILIVISLLIVGLILAFVFRFTIFKTGKYLHKLSNQELADKGYGTYATSFETQCLTSDGKCSTSGVKYTTEYCVPHPTTGKGCINENGEMTFVPKTSVQNCLPNCRKYILNDVSENEEYVGSTVCQYNNPTYNQNTTVCVPPSAKTFQYSVFACINNDSVGDNSCTYTCGSDGITDNNLSGDSDPNLSSYIPACVGNKGGVISLNSFDYTQIGNLPDKGVATSKGFIITNYYKDAPANTIVDLTKFNVSPNYVPIPKTNDLNPSPTGVISYEQLIELDTMLAVYENCQALKPTCKSYGVYKPIDIGSTLTYYNNYYTPITPQNFIPTKNCYVSPYWQPAPIAPNVSNFTNPFIGDAYPGAVGYNMLSGIGQYGVAYEYLTCGPTGNIPLASGPITDPPLYQIPPAYTTTNLCLGLTGSNIPGAGLCYTGLNNIPTVLQSGNTYQICDTVFPNGAHALGWNGIIPAPGLVVPCEYLPSNDVIDFSGISTGGIILNSNLQTLIGKYIQIYANLPSSSKKYFLGLQTTPCGYGTNSDNLAPLSYCNPISPVNAQGYEPQRCVFIYNGGSDTQPSAGAYWGKQNCDGESIELANALNIIISPRNVITSTQIECDLYGMSNGIFGQFIATDTGLGYAVMFFQPMTQADRQNPAKYNPTKFILTWNNSTSQIEISIPSSSLVIWVPDYDGTNPNYISSYNFNLSGYNVPTATILTTRTVPFEGPIIKQGGINGGKDVQTTIGLQRTTPCYYSSCDPETSVEACYPRTCNLYYEFDPAIC